MMSLLTTRLGLPEVTTSNPAGFRALGNARRESRLLEQTATSPDTLPSDFGCAAAAAQDPNAQNVNLKQTLHTSTPITWRARLVNHFPDIDGVPRSRASDLKRRAKRRDRVRLNRCTSPTFCTGLGRADAGSAEM
jgi:hypothetical protein